MQDIDSYLAQFDPHRGPSGWVEEPPVLYAKRMQENLLPQWPEEVLIEWLHKHAKCIDRYAFLRFERFEFERQEWEVSRIPGREAFDDPSFCDSFQNIEERAEGSFDWLANYMLEHGTWNTPIVLLDNPKKSSELAVARSLQSPLHLLEGHRRLSFLNGLRRLNQALPKHDVWIARIPRVRRAT